GMISPCSQLAIPSLTHPQQTRRHTGHDLERLDVVLHHCTRPHYRAGANAHSLENDHPHTQPDIVADFHRCGFQRLLMYWLAPEPPIIVVRDVTLRTNQAVAPDEYMASCFNH